MMELLLISVLASIFASTISLYIAAKVDELAEDKFEEEYNARKDKRPS